MDVNANLASCIQNANNWGHTTYYNICNGTTHIVPWGVVDYALGVLGLMLVVGVIIVILGRLYLAVID